MNCQSRRNVSLWIALPLACLAIVATAEFAFAQGQGQPGRARPGGFGGFGGGGPGGGMGGDWSQLLGMEQVQKELEIVDDQKEGIKKVADEARERMRSSFSGFQGLRDLPEAEREKKMAELREKGAEMAKETRKKLEEVLLPHQAERLTQISVQIRGSGALSDPEIAEKLGLSDEQKQQLEKAREEAGEKMRAMFQPGGGDSNVSREDRMKQFTEAREAATSAAMAVLTSDQKELFEKLKGEKFELDMSQLQRGFGGPGGTGGQGGQRRPGGEGDQPRRRPGGDTNSNSNNDEKST